MPNIPALWHPSYRKETLDLLVKIWTDLDIADRDALSKALVAGPPADTFDHISPTERMGARDRRIFDRIAAIKSTQADNLTDLLAEEDLRLSTTYPHWQATPGERSHFGIWSESRWGNGSAYNVELLKSKEDGELVELLRDEQADRDGLLDAWRLLAGQVPRQVFRVLVLLGSADLDYADVWNYAISGLRESVKDIEIRAVSIALLIDIDDVMIRSVEVSRAAVELLESISAGDTLGVSDETPFWQAFDRTLIAAGQDPSNADRPAGDDWVSLSINRSIGTLATAFLNRLFARQLRVGAKIPIDLCNRLGALLSPASLAHRPARVVCASRLSYLFAVDPDWTKAMLLPNFSWENEDEAVSAWQGYAWQPHIDPLLWKELKPFFLPSFTQEHLALLGESVRPLAQLIALIPIEFGASELPRDMARGAIRSMDAQMRGEITSWLSTYMNRAKLEQPPQDPDQLWTEKVLPWLTSYWPLDPALKDEITSRDFLSIVIATDDLFPTAWQRVEPLIVRFNADLSLEELARSPHPDRYPLAALSLLNAMLDPQDLWFVGETLSQVLGRIRVANRDIANSHIFQEWANRLRVRGQ